MNVLFVGATERVLALRGELRGTLDSVTHCADGKAAIAHLSQHGRHYDWVILDGQAVAAGERDLTDAIRVVGPLCNKRNGEWPGVPRCGVRWNESGILELSCGLHESLRSNPMGSRQDIQELDGVCFEYHAPCRKSA